MKISTLKLLNRNQFVRDQGANEGYFGSARALKHPDYKFNI